MNFRKLKQSVLTICFILLTISSTATASPANKEIAFELKIKPDTIGKHLSKIFHKLGVQNRTEATLKFLEMTGKLILVAV